MKGQEGRPGPSTKEGVAVSKRKAPSLADWFDNCGGWQPRYDLSELRRGIEAGLLDAQDEYGMTALSLAVASGWKEGVLELLRAGADTSLRYFRTGETALHLAVQKQDEAIISALIAAGADPDAATHGGFTSREKWPQAFAGVPQRPATFPAPLIQNAEHLADHYYPRFEIPDRKERESLQPGQAVNLYVYGPQVEGKQNTVKVRITARRGRRPRVRYVARIETPLEQTHLPAGTKSVEFGPENVATVYVPQPSKE
jgi:hypothetical protein